MIQINHDDGFRINWSTGDQDLVEFLARYCLEAHKSGYATEGTKRLASKALINAHPDRLSKAGHGPIWSVYSRIEKVVVRNPKRSFDELMNIILAEWRHREKIGEYVLVKCVCGQLFYSKAAHMCSSCRSIHKKARFE